MGFSCRVEQDSISPDEVRLTTVVVTFPRCILPELLTHRAFSRNTASSRAIPVRRMIEAVERDPFIPEFWGRNQAGMQAREALPALEASEARREWEYACHLAVGRSKRMAEIGVHKQIVNRLLEPFAWTTCVISATTWDNFFEQRCHPDAEPHMQKLAWMIHGELGRSQPTQRDYYGWHLPFITEQERQAHPVESLCRWSAARCARVSYLTHEGMSPSPEDDERLFQKLAGSRPIHASPLEHQARAAPDWIESGNFSGWVQHRVMVEQTMQAAT